MISGKSRLSDLLCFFVCFTSLWKRCFVVRSNHHSPILIMFVNLNRQHLVRVHHSLKHLRSPKRLTRKLPLYRNEYHMRILILILLFPSPYSSSLGFRIKISGYCSGYCLSVGYGIHYDAKEVCLVRCLWLLSSSIHFAVKRLR